MTRKYGDLVHAAYNATRMHEMARRTHGLAADVSVTHPEFAKLIRKLANVYEELALTIDGDIS